MQYVVLPGVMTPAATAQWTRSMRRCQELNDNLVRCDWGRAIDWQALGWDGAEPPEPPTAEMVARAMGCGQRFTPQTAENGILLLRQHCVLPEYFPPAHDEFLMRCVFHEDLLELHRRLLQADEVFSSNLQSSNKSAPEQGGPWHVHPTGLAGSGLFGEACDDVGTCTDVKEYMAQPCVVSALQLLAERSRRLLFSVSHKDDATAPHSASRSSTRRGWTTRTAETSTSSADPTSSVLSRPCARLRARLATPSCGASRRMRRSTG